MPAIEAKRAREREYRKANPETMYRIRERARQGKITVGICALCRDPAARGKTMCERHLSNLIDKNRRRAAESKALGRCATCHQRPKMAPFSNCVECRAAHKQRSLSIRCKEKGITVEQYQEMETKQGGACAICLCPPTPRFGRLHIDHDHKTNLVRGLLCARCNTAIGQLQDDPEIMLRAAAYVRQGSADASILR